MYPILFKIGPLTIYTYGVVVCLGILAWYFVSFTEVRRRGIDQKVFIDSTFWVIIWAFIGARVFYIIVEFKYFLTNPWGVIFSRAGFVFYGGVLFGIAICYFFARKRKIDFLHFADSIVLGIPPGHAIGRIGCFFYGCCYGKPTTSWIGIQFPPESSAGVGGLKVIPTQLISSFFLVIIFLILLGTRKKLKKKGELTLLYLFLYGIFRFIIEFYRGDPRGFIGIFSVSQWISLGLMLVSILFWLKPQRWMQRAESRE